ncbi:sensor histidine kinase [Nonomuraea sp. NPDC050536]|uniref:sensor histidine kinase n=1 Tax=Nonomuraea sp. NPDC050536 TaxID=3364366 RepID=UPI0037C8AEFD
MALLRDPDRPVLFDVVFWVVFAATAVDGFTREKLPIFTVAFAVDLVLLAALWLLLPWNPAAGRRKLLAPAFLLAAIALGMTGSAGTHLPIVLICFANLAFLYGMRLAATVLGVVFVAGFLLTAMLPGRGWADAVVQMAVGVTFAAFVLGMASAVLEARRRREEAQGLLERVRELAVAEERARMARDMHDSIGHHLTVIKVGLENAERFRDLRPADAWDEVRQAKQLTAEALAEARRWVRALRPLALDGHVGSAALERLAGSFDGTGMQVSFEVEGTERRLDPDAELVLYRTLQEGLTNALRHAGASRVHGRLTFDRDSVVLVVGDDGGGSAAGMPGFGLASLDERARALGGAVHAGNAEGGGFEVRAKLPVARS